MNRRGFLKTLGGVAAVAIAAPVLPTLAAEAAPTVRDALNLPPLVEPWNEFGLAFEITQEALEDDAIFATHAKALHRGMRHALDKRSFTHYDNARLLYVLDARP